MRRMSFSGILRRIWIKFWGDIMRVLVGCECSSTLTAAFRRLGVDAFSCDIQKCYGEMPEYHLQGDLREVYDYVILTMSCGKLGIR